MEVTIYISPVTKIVLRGRGARASQIGPYYWCIEMPDYYEKVIWHLTPIYQISGLPPETFYVQALGVTVTGNIY